MEDIYDMKLHKTYSIDRLSYVLRVPGGWIYYKLRMNGKTSATFVPFNNEFQEVK